MNQKPPQKQPLADNGRALLITDTDLVDISAMSLTQDLSSSDLMEDSGLFHASIDRILFSRLPEIFSKVLASRAYTLNIENILACLDSTEIGLLIANTSKQKGQKYLVRQGMPYVQFKLPRKNVKGQCLELFYKEIAAYEAALAQDGSAEKSSSLQKKIDKLDKEVKDLREANEKLQNENTLLRQSLATAKRSEASANNALVSQNILPSNMRMATVRELAFSERSIILRAGRTTLNVPLVLSNIVPERDDKCIVHIEDGSTKGCYFFEFKGVQLRPRAATVVAKTEAACKVRDSERNTWIIEHRNEAEAQILRQLRREDLLLLYIANDSILRFESVLPNTLSDRMLSIQEAFFKFSALSESG